MNKFSKDAGYKNQHKKPLAFLYTNNKVSIKALNNSPAYNNNN